MGIWLALSLIATVAGVAISWAGFTYEKGPENIVTLIGLVWTGFFGLALFVFAWKVLTPDELVIAEAEVRLYSLGRSRFWTLTQIAGARALSSAQGTATVIVLDLSGSASENTKAVIPGNFEARSRDVVDVINDLVSKSNRGSVTP